MKILKNWEFEKIKNLVRQTINIYGYRSENYKETAYQRSLNEVEKIINEIENTSSYSEILNKLLESIESKLWQKLYFLKDEKISIPKEKAYKFDVVYIDEVLLKNNELLFKSISGTYHKIRDLKDLKQLFKMVDYIIKI